MLTFVEREFHLEKTTWRSFAEMRLSVAYRANRGQEFIIGEYLPGPPGFDSLMNE